MSVRNVHKCLIEIDEKILTLDKIQIFFSKKKLKINKNVR